MSPPDRIRAVERVVAEIASLSRELEGAPRAFLGASRFAIEGSVVTDRDGTAVLEREGRIVIPDPVSHGLKAVHERGRPVILNTLRFPLNVIRTFGQEWYAITHAPLPLVSLNGGVSGYVTPNAAQEIVFEEIAAFPLAGAEMDEVPSTATIS